MARRESSSRVSRIKMIADARLRVGHGLQVHPDQGLVILQVVGVGGLVEPAYRVGREVEGDGARPETPATILVTLGIRFDGSELGSFLQLQEVCVEILGLGRRHWPLTSGLHHEEVYERVCLVDGIPIVICERIDGFLVGIFFILAMAGGGYGPTRDRLRSGSPRKGTSQGP